MLAAQDWIIVCGRCGVGVGGGCVGGGGWGWGLGGWGGGGAFVVTLGAIGATKCTGIVLVMDTSQCGDVCVGVCYLRNCCVSGSRA